MKNEESSWVAYEIRKIELSAEKLLEQILAADQRGDKGQMRELIKEVDQTDLVPDGLLGEDTPGAQGKIFADRNEAINRAKECFQEYNVSIVVNKVSDAGKELSFIIIRRESSDSRYHDLETGEKGYIDFTESHG